MFLNRVKTEHGEIKNHIAINESDQLQTLVHNRT